ncbi:LuxR C-terminal-related transcriptional regulator [Thermobifida cellulosilytica]|uniref:LuxR family transcriptional regulator n=1 Tax=Thermobifida cellulosilytica TB100 TaxID=665004 RepID=A0A147KIJ3_THECS|nr:response regulator transcription factor [Thermobifida cellulosilytica]KUP97113.1 LuxR family transcriptional regulator [Thermobifida cellulosilytica TB100]
MPVRVLLVDARPLVRAGLRLVVESDAQASVIGEAGDVRAALPAVRRLLPDVVLTDLELPDGSAADLARGVLEWAAGAAQTVRVLVVASAVDDETAVGVLRSGVRGLLLRDSSPQELLRALRLVAEGGAVLDPSVAARLLDRLADLPPAHRPASPPGLDRLTCRELEVLQLLGRGLSNAEIAGRLVLGETTVKTHVGKVLAKLGLRDRVQAVVYAYEHGLVVPGQGGPPPPGGG